MNMNTILGLALLFFLSEFILMVSKPARKTRVKIKNDRQSLIIFWITIPLSLTLGFFTANYGQWNALNRWVAGLGIGFFLAGLALRWGAIFQLKKAFTVAVAIVEHHRLKTDGLYTYLRHPSYSGLFFMVLGLALAMNSFPSFIVITIPLFLALNYRINIEEQTLKNAFGTAYTDYMKKTWKLIPKIY